MYLDLYHDTFGEMHLIRQGEKPPSADWTKIGVAFVQVMFEGDSVTAADSLMKGPLSRENSMFAGDDPA